jgi:hypothetical protein
MSFNREPWRKLVQIRVAIGHLKDARDCLRAAGASNSRCYVARAIKSAQGAERNAFRFALKGGAI